MSELRRIDEMKTDGHHAGRMRRLWLTLLLALAFTASGVAAAAAMPACPMVEAQAVSHDCCPDNKAPDDGDGQKTKGCFVGMACRMASATAPSLEPIRLSDSGLPVNLPILGSPSPPQGPLNQHWRPPRLI